LEATAQQFWIVSAITGVGVGVFVFLMGSSLLVSLLAAFGGGFGLPNWVLNYLFKRRKKRFLQEFANAIDVIVRGVKSGLPLNDCLGIISRESPDPISTEFAALVEQQRVGARAGRPGAVEVHRRPQMQLGPAVHQAVAGSAVESNDVPAGWQPGEVGDAPQIQHGPVLAARAKYRCVEGWSQRRALSARRDIAAAEVRDDTRAAELGEQRRIAQLDCITRAGPVAYGLSMTADGAQAGGLQRRLRQHVGDGGGVDAGERIGAKRRALQFAASGSVQREQFGTQRGVERPMRGRQYAWRRSGKVDQGRVDPVEAGPRHEADIELAAHSSWASGLAASNSSLASSGSARRR